MNHKKEQPKQIHDHVSSSAGMSSDDVSMLNQVLQQVKGISCVSCESPYEIIEPAATE